MTRTGAVVDSGCSTIEQGIEKLCVQKVRDLQSQSLRPEELRVQVEACCVNFPDLMQLTNSHQHKQTFPAILGMEISGVVLETGDGCKFKPGDKIVAMTAEGLSTQLILHQQQCMEMPARLSWEEAAAFRIGFETAFHCLVEQANLRPGQTVLVNGGTGGMGLAAVQLATKVFGCTVIATGGSHEKLKVVKDVGGAKHVINYKETPKFQQIVKDFTNGKGVDVVFDTVGGATFQQCLRSTAFGAKVLIVGFTSGEIPQIPSNYVLIKCLSVIGCRANEIIRRTENGQNLIASPRYTRLTGYTNQGLIKPHISHVFPFTTKGVQQAFKTLQSRQVVGRVVVQINKQTPSSKL